MTEAARQDADRRPSPPLLEYGILLGIAAAGLAIKQPFGLFLQHVMKIPKSTGAPTLFQLLNGDVAALIIVLIGCLLHARSGLPAAPWLERRVFKAPPSSEKLRVWRNGFLAALVCVAIFAVFQIAQKLTGTTAPLAKGISGGAIAHSDLIKLIALYPLAFIGAALSEEMVFRFGVMSSVMGLMSFLTPGRNANNAVAFWIANIIQACWFGYVHVHAGIVTATVGGDVALQILLAPQTWMGIVFGLVYRRWGIETSIVAHMGTDILAPVFLGLFAYLVH